MEYAVIEAGGKQYKAVVGKILELEKINLEPGSPYTFDKVLLYTSDGVARIGRPQIEGILVKGKILEHIKGEKIRVAKFKAKARYRKVMGHRQLLTRVQIENISLTDSGKKEAPNKQTKVKTTKTVKK